ncbi:MAG: hybrid sensor histidine kinase/response regulator [Chloroflexia bacterium]|nr:hybrid sensor histidine kinase/response regulator [Chloroflexia bacterium]
MDLSSFYHQFREESVENVRVLGEGLLNLEQATDPSEQQATIAQIFRAIHTIKGSARMLGFDEVGRLTHELETVLGEMRQGKRALERPLANVLLRSGDAILAMINATIEGQPCPVNVDELIGGLGDAQTNTAPAAMPATDVSEAPPAPATPVPPKAAPSPRGTSASAAAPPSTTVPLSRVVNQRHQNQPTIRVRVDRLDRMLNLAGELVIGQQSLATHGEQWQVLEAKCAQQRAALTALEEALENMPLTGGQRKQLAQHLETLHTISHEVRGLVHQESDRAMHHTNQHAQLVKDLEQEVMRARLLPIATVYASLPRAVRDLTQTTGHEARIELYGETVELDRKVLELINDPLLHLVRNAVDHGIEPPAEREAAGKPPYGLIEVRAETLGGKVRIVISDDGRGMDPQRLRERAVRLGMLSAEASALMPNNEAFELIFQPGFSTASQITEISGRGVGMDVVRANLTELGGQVEVESELGHGSRIILTLPLTLVTTRVLLVRTGRSIFALPATSCYGTVWAYHNAIRSLEGQPTILVEERTLALIALAELLGLSEPSPFSRHSRVPAIITGSNQRPVALLVDELVDEREAVVKPLGPLFEKQQHFGGAIQLGDGTLVLLLNPVQVIQSKRSNIVVSQAPAVHRSRLLVVDDSFTTRELICSILQSAGYDVTPAVDGADALGRMQQQSYDLVVSDIEMPRMDGFGLTSQIRANPTTSRVPVILITSLASEEHRRRGLEAGAQAYIVKSQFDQESLLDVVQQLLGTIN